MPFNYEIRHRPGRLNVAADALSRNICASTGLLNSLQDIHASLCHPGVRRLMHYVRCKNLPFSMEDVKRVIEGCRTCAVVKPRYYRPEKTPLVRAMRPMDRLSIDFKGPLPTSHKGNQYLLIAVDEFSRFVFAFPCKNMNSSTVIEHLTGLFATFGLPSYVHSDRAQSFLSGDLKRFPAGNGQTNLWPKLRRMLGPDVCRTFLWHP